MKDIYTFTVNKKINTEVVEETKEGKLTKTVETNKPVTIVIKHPSRSESETQRYEYAKEYSNATRKGLLTNAIVEKMYDKDGFISDLKNQALEITNHLLKIQDSYKEFSLIEEKSEEDKEKMQEIEDDWKSSQVKLQELKNSVSNIFDHTAETFAQNKAMLWLTTNLVYVKQDSGELKPFFKGDTFDKKLAHFDALSEIDDAFNNEVINRATIYVSFWYNGNANTKEEFDLINEEFNFVFKKSEDDKAFAEKIAQNEEVVA